MTWTRLKLILFDVPARSRVHVHTMTTNERGINPRGDANTRRSCCRIFCRSSVLFPIVPRTRSTNTMPKKPPKDIDVTLERMKLVDELFAAIDNDPGLKNIYKWWFWLVIVLFVFALLFLILGIVISLAYDHKGFYAAAAGLSVFHLIGCPLGYFGHQLRIRYLIFACHLLNCLWLGASLILLAVNVFNGKNRTR